jgi:hypothetical protein
MVVGSQPTDGGGISVKKMDGRRSRYVPLSVDFASGNTGTKLLGKFGHGGLLTWIAYLAACKRSTREGTFRYGSEDDGWRQLGLDYPEPPGFTLAAFFAYTGQLKQTRRTRVGRLTDVTCRRWGEWNNTWRTQQKHENRRDEGSQNPRTEGENTETFQRQSAPIENRDRREVEEDSEQTSAVHENDFERQHHFRRLLDCCTDADARTPVVLRRWADELSVAGLAEAHRAVSRYPRANKSAYAYGTLSKMVLEGTFKRRNAA